MCLCVEFLYGLKFEAFSICVWIIVRPQTDTWLPQVGVWIENTGWEWTAIHVPNPRQHLIFTIQLRFDSPWFTKGTGTSTSGKWRSSCSRQWRPQLQPNLWRWNSNLQRSGTLICRKWCCSSGLFVQACEFTSSIWAMRVSFLFKSVGWRQIWHTCAHISEVDWLR